MLIALFLSGMRYGTYVYVLLLNIGGALSMLSGASSASSLQSSWDWGEDLPRDTELSSRKKLSSLTKSNLD